MSGEMQFDRDKMDASENHAVSWFETRRESRRFKFWKWSIALILALVIHPLWFFVLPGAFALAQPLPVPLVEEEKSYPLELMDEAEQPQYVETNPDSPENEPDDSSQISDRNQQSAQENVAGPTPSPTPFLEGESPDSPKIVEGTMPSPESAPTEAIQTIRGQSERSAESPESSASPETATGETMPNALPPPRPTPDFLQDEAPSEGDGVHFPIIKTPGEAELSEPSEENQVLNLNIPPSVLAQLSRATENQTPAPDQRPKPQPRPRLDPKVLPGPLLDASQYAARMGPIGFDARFSQFGYYLSRMFETIQLQWYSLLTDVSVGQENRPASVTISYTLDREGKVTESVVLDSNAGPLATLLCKDAIESRAPFGAWNEQMVDQLGDQTTITLRFIYL
jgi:hypothetical protein